MRRWKAIVGAVIAALVLAQSAWAQQSGTGQTALANGAKLYSDGNYRAAVEPLRQAIADERLPVADRNRARQMLAHSQYSLGEVSQAMVVLRELFTGTPAYELAGQVPADFRQLFEEVKVATRERVAMEQQLKAAAAAAPTGPAELLAGAGLYQQGDYEGAIVRFERAVTLGLGSADRAKARRLLAASYFRRNDVAKASNTIRALLAEDPAYDLPGPEQPDFAAFYVQIKQQVAQAAAADSQKAAAAKALAEEQKRVADAAAARPATVPAARPAGEVRQPDTTVPKTKGHRWEIAGGYSLAFNKTGYSREPAYGNGLFIAGARRFKYLAIVGEYNWHDPYSLLADYGNSLSLYQYGETIYLSAGAMACSSNGAKVSACGGVKFGMFTRDYYAAYFSSGTFQSGYSRTGDISGYVSVSGSVDVRVAKQLAIRGAVDVTSEDWAGLSVGAVFRFGGK